MYFETLHDELKIRLFKKAMSSVCVCVNMKEVCACNFRKKLLSYHEKRVVY